MEHLTPTAARAYACADPVPSLIADAVDAHFAARGGDMAESLRTKVEDAQLRLLDGFFHTIQDRFVRRITDLEATNRRNNALIGEIREHTLRSEDDLSRLASGISRLIGAPVKAA